ncbi:uncharacterized protein MYCFIDRAFT_156218 [Pseudocercospora fijiensis CIRAD86]|uniref:MYND-type domain-containing protein n=1 Tax=Pseudocercospora fijiensis (strain CIRAD86) TaxID=383855 RepID=M2YRV6_PSEFD|nr:uncharacterized protein MYCFIDRAFT_156218 [Pseudocercospora fijiensis CIRAD86]EME80475.1 hypothetical protein MYCFIDRAFT_156218 [Pseudocercospora fijiensis CIRAD86]
MSDSTAGSINAEELQQKCARCSKTGGPLKKCAKCRSILYCDRECQTLHWKMHKKECSRLASSNTAATRTAGGSKNTAGGFTSIANNTFLNNRPEKEVYKLLVDIVRMRQEDTYTFEGDTMSGTIYNGESSSEPAFRDMIRRAKNKAGFLPPWWTDSKLEECVRLNKQALQCAQEKSDIQESWGDNTMPMKLRMLGEKIYGNTPGTMPGQGDRMLELQMMLERGGSGMMSSHLELR